MWRCISCSGSSVGVLENHRGCEDVSPAVGLQWESSRITVDVEMYLLQWVFSGSPRGCLAIFIQC
ncbi:hypothetical protein BgiBS90_015224, partial [Biomphalaria glabrata]